MLLLSRGEQNFECGHVPLDPFGIAGGLEPELASWRTDRAGTRRGLETDWQTDQLGSLSP